MKFVHAADLHLDSPLRGLERYEGAPVELIRDATRRAMANLVSLCIEEQVDFLLLAGDLYDGDWRDYSVGLFFTKEMARLREAGIRVFSIRGNHDAQSRITRHLSLPDNVTELGTRRPRTVIDERLGVAVHGQGFAARAVTDDLTAHYPEAEPGLFHVGLLHTCLDGRPGHDPYAPTSLERLRGKGYDYWALGHVHVREVVSTEPWVVFPGNLQGRHARETGAKGATLVTVDDAGRITADPVALDVVRWEHVIVDAGDHAAADDVVEAARGVLQRTIDAADGRLVAARVTVTGETDAHRALHGDLERWTAELRRTGLELGADAVWLEKIRFATRARLDTAALRERDDPIGQLARALHSLRQGGPDADAVRAELAEFERKLPPEAREGPDGVRLDDPATWTALLDDIEQTLLPRLLAQEEGA